MSRNALPGGIVALSLMAAACQDRGQAAAPSPDPAVSSTSANPAIVPTTAITKTERWLGQWNGPEGTSLILSKDGARYVVKINSLDGPATYEGMAVGNRIEFNRNGSTESIRASSGKETGMKWLLEKSDCLTIRQGEGFCRD